MKRLLAPLVLFLASRTASAEEPPTFPISITVATEHGVPAQDDAWIQTQIEDARVLYDPLGVRFRWTLRKEMGPSHAHMVSREDRDALAAFVEKNVIDIFVVASLEDVDEPGRIRRGVAWTSKPNGKRFIILSAIAPKNVLAHELGHFFGNPHSDTPDNLMSYTRTGAPVFFDAGQITKVRAFAAQFLASGRLPDVGPPRFLP